MPVRRASLGSSNCSPLTHSLRRVDRTGTVTVGIRSFQGAGPASAASSLMNAVKRVCGLAATIAVISSRA